MTAVCIDAILSDPLYDKNYDNITLYGVLTFVSESKPVRNGKSLMTNIILVDNTCKFNEKLKCNLFVDGNTTTFQSICKLGDIIRFHRLRVNIFFFLFN